MTGRMNQVTHHLTLVRGKSETVKPKVKTCSWVNSQKRSTGLYISALKCKVRQTANPNCVLRVAATRKGGVKNEDCYWSFKTDAKMKAGENQRQNKTADVAILFSTCVCHCPSHTSHQCVPASQRCTDQLILNTMCLMQFLWFRSLMMANFLLTLTFLWLSCWQTKAAAENEQAF